MVRPGNFSKKLKRRQHAKSSRETDADVKSKVEARPKETRDLATRGVKKKKANAKKKDAMADVNGLMAAAASMSVDDMIKSNAAPAKEKKAAKGSMGCNKKKRAVARKAGNKRRAGAAHKQRRKGIN